MLMLFLNMSNMVFVMLKILKLRLNQNCISLGSFLILSRRSLAGRENF